MSESNRTVCEDDRFFDVASELFAVASKRGGQWKRVNPAFRRIMGRGEDELRKTSFFKLTHPCDLEKSKKAFAELKADGQPVLLENRMRRKDGGYQSISWKLAQFPSERLIYCAGRDISDIKLGKEVLRAVEARFHQVFDTASEGIWLTDADFRVVEVNDQMADMLGFSKEEIVGRKVEEFADREDATDIGERNGKLRQGISQKYERKFRRKDGSILCVQVSATPVFDSGGEFEGALGMAMDLTERRKAEGELGLLNETLERRVEERASSAEARTRQLQALAVELIEAEERERHRFAKLLHDDLQQILAAARLQLSAAREDMPDLNVLATVENLIRESIRKARALSHDLSPAVLHHSGLIAALKWLSKHMLDHFGLQVEIDDRAARDFENSSFKVFIFRAVRELLFNVVKHAEVKKAKIGLSSSQENLVLTVSDQGKGFDPSIPLSCDVQAGLGLISLRERALAIGGELVVESAPGQGSRFTLTIPFIRVKTGETENFGWPAESRTPTPTAFSLSTGEGDIRVLFADDHQVMRQGLIELMTGQPNIEVVGEAASGKEALELTRRLKPDVVLMDVSMPEMDGIEATRRIKEELPEVRVIGLTMFDGEQMARRMLNAGVEAFVSKTASSSELLRAIYGVGKPEDESG